MPTARLTFSVGWSARRTFVAQHWDLDAGVEITLDALQTLETWERSWVQPLQHLLIFATRKRVEVERFTAIVRREGAAEEVGEVVRRAASDDFWETKEVEVIRRRRWVQGGGEDGQLDQKVLVSALALGGQFTATVRDWFHLHGQLEGAGRALFGDLNAERIHLENRLLTLMSAAEGYHRALHEKKPLDDATHERSLEEMLGVLPTDELRSVYRDPLRYANSERQRARLRMLMRRASRVVPELAPLVQETVNQLVNARNYFTHFDEEGHADVPEFPELIRLTYRLILVLQINLLLDLRLDADWVNQTVRRSYTGEEFP